MANIIFSMAPGINDSIFGKSQAPIAAFIEKYAESFEKKSIANVLFKKNPSKQYAEKYSSMTAMRGMLPVGENGAPPVDGNREGFSKTLEHMVWKDRFAISREIIDDSKFMDLRRQPAAFTQAHHRVLEDFAAAIFGGAAAGNTFITYGGERFSTTSVDGRPAFSGSHRSITDTLYTQSNLYSNTLTADSIGRLETQMQQFTDDDGNILDINPDTIIIPNDADLKNAVFTALGSEQKPGTSDNDWNYQVGRWNVIVWPYLTKHVKGLGKPWFMWDSNYGKVYDDMVWLERIPLTIDSYIDRATHANVWDAYLRFSMGFVDWRSLAAAGMGDAAEIPNSPIYPIPNIRTVILSATVSGDTAPPKDGDKLYAAGIFSDGGTGADGTVAYAWENLSGSNWVSASSWTGHNTDTLTTVTTTDDGKSFRCKITYTDENGASSVYTPKVTLA